MSLSIRVAVGGYTTTVYTQPYMYTSIDARIHTHTYTYYIELQAKAVSDIVSEGKNKDN